MTWTDYYRELDRMRGVARRFRDPDDPPHPLIAGYHGIVTPRRAA